MVIDDLDISSSYIGNHNPFYRKNEQIVNKNVKAVSML